MSQKLTFYKQTGKSEKLEEQCSETLPHIKEKRDLYAVGRLLIQEVGWSA